MFLSVGPSGTLYSLEEVGRYVYGVVNQYRGTEVLAKSRQETVSVSELFQELTPAEGAAQRAREVSDEYSVVATVISRDFGTAKIQTQLRDGREASTVVYLTGDDERISVNAAAFTRHPSLFGLKVVEWSLSCPRIAGDSDAADYCVHLFREESEGLAQRVLQIEAPILDPRDVPALNHNLGWPETNWGIVFDEVPADLTYPSSGAVRLMATPTNFGWSLAFVFEDEVAEVEYRVLGRAEYMKHPGPTMFPRVDKVVDLEVRYRRAGGTWQVPVVVPFDPKPHQEIFERAKAEAIRKSQSRER
ncbi:MAG: hypothetical protein K8J08_03570 [Thermoanaerobaculia bacterium]|nr:hypothetical protein [Thermoanaerobaculia bacterium]